MPIQIVPVPPWNHIWSFLCVFTGFVVLHSHMQRERERERERERGRQIQDTCPQDACHIQTHSHILLVVYCWPILACCSTSHLQTVCIGNNRLVVTVLVYRWWIAHWFAWHQLRYVSFPLFYFNLSLVSLLLCLRSSGVAEHVMLKAKNEFASPSLG